MQFISAENSADSRSSSNLCMLAFVFLHVTKITTIQVKQPSFGCFWLGSQGGGGGRGHGFVWVTGACASVCSSICANSGHVHLLLAEMELRVQERAPAACASGAAYTCALTLLSHGLVLNRLRPSSRPRPRSWGCLKWREATFALNRIIGTTDASPFQVKFIKFGVIIKEILFEWLIKKMLIQRINFTCERESHWCSIL